jgi:hypothetical protein
MFGIVAAGSKRLQPRAQVADANTVEQPNHITLRKAVRARVNARQRLVPPTKEGALCRR